MNHQTDAEIGLLTTMPLQELHWLEDFKRQPVNVVVSFLDFDLLNEGPDC